MRPKKKPRLMSNDGSDPEKTIEQLLAEDALNATMHEGLFDRLDSFSPDYDRDLVKRLKNRPVSSREQNILNYLAANDISPRKNQRIDPTFLTNTGGTIDYSLMNVGGDGHVEAYGRHLPMHNVNEVTPRSALDPSVRVEEDIHSLQKNIFGWNKPLSNKSRKNRSKLKKELKGNLPEEDYEYHVTDNYALQGRASLIEFEAKMIATKMTLLEQGILDSADEVITKEKLDEIVAWKRNQFDWDNAEKSFNEGKASDFTTILYAHDSPKMRDLLLKTLNDL